MSYSYQPHTTSAGQTTYTFSFAGIDPGYISTEHLVVEVRTSGQSEFTTLDTARWYLSGTNQITLVPAIAAPADGKNNLRIRRVVPKEVPYASFPRGSMLDMLNLDRTFIQTLEAFQEFLDGFLPAGFYFQQNINMNGHKFTNLGPGTQSGDSVNWDQWDNHEQRIYALEHDLTGVTSKTIPYYYIATGGEVRWAPPGRTFDSAIMFINGVFQNQNLGAFSISDNGFNFAEPLVKGDEVYALIGSTPATGSMTNDQDVEVLQPFTGAVIRNQHVKNAESVSTGDFGVPKDGIADSTLKLQQAADASYNAGVPLTVLGGTYRITSPVMFRRELVTEGSVIFIADDNGDSPPTVHMYFERKSDIKDLTFNNIVVHVSPAAESSVYMPSDIRRNNFINSPLIVGQDNVITAGYDISLNKFTGSKSRSVHAVSLLNVNHVMASHNEIQEFDYGFLVAPTRSFAANNIVIEDNRITGFLFAAVRLQGTSMFRVVKPTVRNNTLLQGKRDTAATARGAIMGTWAVDLVAEGNTISCVSAAVTLQSVQGYKFDKNNVRYASTLNGLIARSCSDAVITDNTFDSGNITGTNAILIGSSSLLPITTGDTYPSRNLKISGNRFNCRGQAVKVENTDKVSVHSNVFTSQDAISAVGLLYFGSGVTNGNHFDNKFNAPSGTPVRNDSGSGVVSGVGDQSLVISSVAAPSVSAPVIVTSDPVVNGGKSYLVQFTLGDYKQIKQLVDIENKKTLSNWMSSAVSPTLGWNSSAWNSSNNTISDLIVDGLMYDTYGVENFANFRSCMIIDDKNKLTCRNFATAAYTGTVPLMIGAACFSERAWQSATFRCPLIVDGSIYNPVPTGLLTEAAYSVQISGRTAIGQKSDGTYVILVVDGATDISGTTMANMAAKLLAAGCLNAFNLDGGGSATLWYNGSVINSPTDAGGERAIPSVMYV